MKLFTFKRVHILGLLFVSALTLLWIRSWSAGDFLIIESPGRSRSIYVERSTIAYYSTPASADNPWSIWTDHVEGFSLPNGHPSNPVLGHWRIDLGNVVWIRLSLPAMLVLLALVPLYWALDRGLPFPPRLVPVVLIGCWPLVLGPISSRTPDAILTYLQAFPYAAVAAIILLWLRDLSMRPRKPSDRPWPWEFAKRRRMKRARAGLCVECGYDLRGSRSRCPECGKAFARSIAHAFSSPEDAPSPPHTTGIP